MAEIPNLAVATGSIERVAFSPKEFAALFGKSQTWGYRQIYADKVSTITEYGRILIPAAEVERILATAGVYDGKKPPLIQRSKAELQKLAPKLAEAWAVYLSKRRISSKKRPQESINAVLMAHQKSSSSRRKIEPTASALSILAARKKTRRRSD